MKKLIVVFVIAFSGLTLTGCDSKEDKQTAARQQEVERYQRKTRTSAPPAKPVDAGGTSLSKGSP